jgi:hypothetical protein
MNKSTLKTKMRRAGFRNSPNRWTQWNHDGTVITGLWRQAWRNNWMYCKGFGRHFRVRWKDGVVDIGEEYATFDRWANSLVDCQKIEDFVEAWCK